MKFIIDRRDFLIAGATAATLPVVKRGLAFPHDPCSVTVTDLKVDSVSYPMGLESRCPRLSWRLESGERNVRQSAYRILVSSNECAARQLVGDLWDSGRVDSGQSFGIAYEGLELASRTRYWWTVQIWEENGRSSPTSHVSWWEMGLLKATDWKGVWIAAEGAKAKADREVGLRWIWGEPTLGRSVRRFRYRFSLPTATESGQLYATANDWKLWTQISRIWIDEKSLMGDGVWDESVSLTAQTESSACQLELGKMEAGEHLICVEVRTADLSGFAKVMSESSLVYGLAVVGRFKLVDQREHTISTGREWKTSLTESEGWYRDHYDDTSWNRTRTAQVGGYQPLPLQPAVYLRREFRAETDVISARLYVTALGVYEAFINGSRVGTALLSPEISQYAKRVLYQVYDVTSQIQHGSNALGIIVGDGWYGSFDGRFSWGAPPRRLLAQLELRFSDGSHRIVATDASWKVAESPIRSTELKVGETYDARLEQQGWDRPGFDASGWADAEVARTPSCRVTAQISPSIRATQVLRPVAISEVKPNEFVIDFGQCFSGWCRLRAKGIPGAQVEMRFGELLTEAGEVDQPYPNIGAPKRDVFILRGDPEGETFEPRFTYRGFRYVQISGSVTTHTAQSMEGIVVHTALATTGSLATDHELIQQVWRNAVWALRSSLIGVPVDTPSREQRCFLNTAGVVWDGAAFNMDVGALTHRHMDNMADALTPDGTFGVVVPAPHHNNAFLFVPGSSPGYGDACIILPWTAWRMYGDTAIIARHWETMSRYLRFIKNNNSDYIWRNKRGGDFFEWLGLEQITGDRAYPETPKDLIATAYWAHSAKLLGDMAEAIGKNKEAEWLRTTAERVRTAFVERFVSEDGTVGSGSQSGYVIALRFSLLPQEVRYRSATRLATDIIERGTSLTTGVMGTQFILDVLAEAGFGDLAYSLLLRTEFPSWGYMIRQGATSIWESWSGGNNLRTPDGELRFFPRARNHPELGTISGFLFRRIAGIDAESPGFQRILIRPLLDPRVKRGGGDYDSMMGRISTRWSQSGDGTYSLDVTIPANASARVHLPTSKDLRVFESNLPIHNRVDIEIVDRQDKEVVVSVGSGTYEFRVKRTAT